MTDALLHLARAIEYQRRMWADGSAPGRAQVALRESILALSAKDLGVTAMRQAEATLAKLRALTPDDMPPPPEDLATLIDTIAMRHGFTSRADAWRMIGVAPDTGRGLLGRQASAISWPVIFTARAYALDPDRHEKARQPGS